MYRTFAKDLYIQGQKFCMVKFCVVIFEMCFSICGKNINTETDKSEQTHCLFRLLGLNIMFFTIFAITHVRGSEIIAQKLNHAERLPLRVFHLISH